MAVLAGLALAGPVLAQAVEAPGFRPGRESERLEQPAQPGATMELMVPEGGGGAAVPEAEAIAFDLTAITIDGITRYSQDEFGPLYQPLLEKRSITLADIYRVAEAITTRYRDDGFVLSRAIVPAQRITDGAVRLQVVEGFIDRTAIESEALPADDPLRRRIQAFLDRITEQRPVRMAELERFLLLINEMGGVSGRAVIRPSPSEQLGASELLLVVERREFGGSVVLDNYGSKYVGPLQAMAEATLFSPLGLGEKLTLRTMGAKPLSELQYVQGEVTMPLGTTGLMLRAAIARSRSLPGFLLHPLDVRAETWTEELALSYAALRSRAANLILAAGYRHRDITTDILGQTFNEENIRSLYLNGTYDFADAWGGTSLVSLTYTRGLDWLNATGQNDALAPRPEASPQFHKLSGEVLRQQALWDNIDLLAAAQWQYTNDPLYSGEEFSLGGKTFGRGYDPGEISGDRGVAGKVELRYTDLVGDESVAEYLNAYQLYGFYDLGMVWNLDAADQGSDNEQRSLASAGIGVQAFVQDWLALRLEVARPLTRTPAARLSKDPDSRKDPNLYFSVTSKF